jgi:tight adherence protein C
VIVVLLLGLFLTGLATVLVARAAAMPRTRVADSLAQISSYGYEVQLVSTDEVVSPDGLRGSLDRAAGALGAALARRSDSIKEPEIRRLLVTAGMYRTSPRTFLGYQALLLLAGGVVGFWWARSTGQPLLFTLAAVIGGSYLGFRVPAILVRQRGKRRMGEIERELPELIDILVVTIEAGLGFTASLQLAAERLTGALGDELRLTLQEQRMGLGTNEALRNLLARCETPGIMAFVRSMLQGEQLGVSVGQIMRDLAREMRLRRRQMAEERAQKAPIKILFPLVFLIFPAMFVVVLYPAIKAILDTL